MNTISKGTVWTFVVLGLLSVALTFYQSVVREDFTVAYCDEEGNCYRTMPEEWLEEETVFETDGDREADVGPTEVGQTAENGGDVTPDEVGNVQDVLPQQTPPDGGA